MNPQDEIVTLTSVRNEVDAHIIAAALEAEGIFVELSGEYTANFRAEAPSSVRVKVSQSQFERAQQILRDGLEGVSDVDWSQVDVGQPEE
jgi:hypothetical protein